jgi:hypothetical protein
MRNSGMAVNLLKSFQVFTAFNAGPAKEFLLNRLWSWKFERRRGD